MTCVIYNWSKSTAGDTLASHTSPRLPLLIPFVYFWTVLHTSTGKRGAFRTSDHDANWSDDSWTVPQLGPNNPKKLKKSKSKDESSQGWVRSPHPFNSYLARWAVTQIHVGQVLSSFSTAFGAVLSSSEITDWHYRSIYTNLLRSQVLLAAVT